MMTTGVTRCREEQTVEEVMEMMTAGRFRHVPVETDGKLAGIISIGDVVKARMREVELEAEQMKAYIAS
ncbi:CBS domain protein [compost metagenome]